MSELEKSTSSSRECDLCNECCVVYKLDFLNKPAGVLCHHYDPKIGCVIHNKPEQHPVCRNYQCLYKNAAVNVPRPDKAGYIFASAIRVEDALIVSMMFRTIPSSERFQEVVAKFNEDNPTLVKDQKMIFWSPAHAGPGLFIAAFGFSGEELQKLQENKLARMLSIIEESKNITKKAMNAR